MSESRIRKTREVAEAVSSILAKGNCRCALIGAGALAVHGYARQSVDLDLATYENPFDSLREIVQRLHDNGYDAELVTPDAEDPLGGVINVTGADFDLVQIINFLNPLNRQRVHALVGEALAELPANNLKLNIISAELLIVLKLFAGDVQSLNDIAKLLEANTKIDRRHVAELAGRANLAKEWSGISGAG